VRPDPEGKEANPPREARLCRVEVNGEAVSHCGIPTRAEGSDGTANPRRCKSVRAR